MRIVHASLTFFAAVLLLVLLDIPANADNCRRVVVTPAVVTNHVVQEVVAVPVIAQFVPVVVYPSYGAGYVTPAPMPAAPAATSPDVVQLLQRLDARLQRLEQGPGVGAAPVPPMPRAAQATGNDAVIFARCASCHDVDVAGAKGGKVALTAGNTLLPWTETMRLDVLEALSSGRMPKGGTLTEDEATKAVAVALNRRK